MARYNEILVGRFNRFLQKYLGLKGEPPAPQLASEIMAVHSFFNGAEDRYLEQWELFGWNINQVAGGAGNTSAARFRNPATSNVVAVFTKITFSGALLDTAPVLLLSSQSADLPTVLGPTGRLDRRGRPQSTIILSQTGAGGGFSGNWRGAYPANSSIDVILTDMQEIPLLPGDAIDLAAGVANQALAVSVFWRERALEEGERF